MLGLVAMVGVAAAGIVATAPGAPPAGAGPAIAGPTTAPGYAAVAAHLGVLAHRVLQVQKMDPGNWKMAAALLEAAQRMDGAEPRYPRLLVDALFEIKDDPNIFQERMAAAQAFRKLQPEDRSIQVLIIELFLSQMQSAEKKEAYLNDLLGRLEIHPEVRSVVAVRLSDVLMEKKSEEEVQKALREALRLNPLNLEALQREFSLTVRSTTQPVERAHIEVAMLRSNPNQFGIMVDLAQQLADVGLVDESLNWFTQAGLLANMSHSASPRDYVLRYAVEAFIADQNQLAAQGCEEILKSGEDQTALMLRLMQEQRKENKQSIDQYRSLTHNAIVNRLQQIRNFLGVKSAATQPSGGEEIAVPDLSGDGPLLAKSESRETQQGQAAYVDSLLTLAWFEVYFNQKPKEAKRVTDFLDQILPANAGVARIVGWIYLVDGDATAAKQKLSAVADRDALAAMGLIRLGRAGAEDAAKLDAQAAQLLSQNPSGLTGATLWNEFHARQIKLTPKPDAEPMRAELRKFSAGWLKILDKPQNYYLLKAEPTKVSFEFSEPVLARVSLQNIGSDDITVGRDGVIRPDMWFDANIPQLKAAVPQPMQGVAIERLWQQGVLHPKQIISQVVRLDDGALSMPFMQNPSLPLSLTMTVRTNWAVAQGNVVFSLPAGLSVALRAGVRAGAFSAEPRRVSEGAGRDQWGE